MKTTKDIKEKINKLEMKIDIENNYKLKNVLDNNKINRIANKRKNILNTKTNETKNKQLTTETIFYSKNVNNYQPVHYKISNSNPFRNTSNKPIENSNKKKNSLLNKKKLNLNSSESKIEKFHNKEKEIVIKSNYKNNDLNLSNKKNIIEKQIKNTTIQIKENKLNIKDNQYLKNKKEDKMNINKLNQKLVKKNGKDEYIINADKINRITSNRNNDNFKKEKNIVIHKEKGISKNIKDLKQENGKINKSEKPDKLTERKKEKDLKKKDKNEQEHKIKFKKGEEEINESKESNDFQIIVNNSNLDNISENNEIKKFKEIDLTESENTNSLINKEEYQQSKKKIFYNGKKNESVLKENNINKNKIEKNNLSNKVFNNQEKNGIIDYNNNIINNGKNQIDFNNNINGSIKEKFSQSYVEPKNKINKLEDINNGLESIHINEDNLNNKMNESSQSRPLKINYNIEKKEGQNNNDEDELFEEDKLNPLTNILNNIQDLIFQSKNKIEKDLHKVDKKEKENNLENNSNEKRGYQKSRIKILELKNNNEISMKIKKRRINQKILDERYITENEFKANKIIKKEKSVENNTKKRKLIKKGNNNKININKSYANNNKIGFKIDNSNENEENNTSKKDLKKSMSKKKDRYIKYSDVDLNTLFSKSSKRVDKNKQNINNFENEEENGGKVNNFEENERENFDEFIKEKKPDNNNVSNKIELKKIMISKKINQGINELKIVSKKEKKESESEGDELKDINKELINEITELKKEVEHSKNQMKIKDAKLLKYKNQYDKIAIENAFNMAEIENLEEELLKKKSEMYKKTKKIKELTDKNIGLEQEMNNLKIYYKNNNYVPEKFDKTNKPYINQFNNNNINDKSNEGEENISQYDESESNINYDELSVDELHNKRNALIKERNNITFLFDKFPIKLVSKAQYKQKQELESRLKVINNNLMKIRLQLKNFNQ